MSKQFDVFVSYKSEDATDAEHLVEALRRRGVRVWLDKDAIRPGDRFAEALEDGLATCKAVAMVVTPDSVKSNWVKDEYYRALSLANDGELQLIPLLFRDTKLPGFLASRHYVDFRNDVDFERSVDQLVWPGITGKSVAAVAIYPGLEDFRDPSGHPQLSDLVPWYHLSLHFARNRLRIVGGEDIDRAPWRMARVQETSPTRIVAIVDPFEGWPMNRHARNTPQDYVDFIFGTRDRSRDSTGEIVFLLFHHSEAWEKVAHGLNESTVKRLRHYFSLHTDVIVEDAGEHLERMWWRIQHELLKAESFEDANAVGRRGCAC